MAGVGDDERGGFIRRLQSSFTPYRFINLGVGGNTTRDMLKRCGQVEAHRPFDLIVLLGCNDLPRANDECPQVRADLVSSELGRNSGVSKRLTRRVALPLTDVKFCIER
jgi:hypothetical protein